MSIAQNFPAIAPSLLLDFANVQALDNRITFTRATTGTYYGTRTAKAEENFVTWSQEVDNAAWTKIAVSITANSIAAPDGTTTADTIDDGTATTTVHRVLSSATSFTSGLAYTFSCFLKNNTRNFAQVYFGTSSFGATAFANFDLATGVLGTVGAGVTASINNVGSGWYRCVITATATASVSDTAVIGMITNATAARGETYTGTNQQIYAWGAQLEQRSAVTAYTPTTTQAITNYISVLETAAIGVARFDHNPTTFESLGLLVEQQSTNLVTYSEQFDNAAWVKVVVSVAANSTVAPDGTISADLYTETGTGAHRIQQSYAATAGVTYTLSCYMKNINRRYGALSSSNFNNFSATFDLQLGTTVATAPATSQIVPVGNGWYRCSITFAATTTTSSNVFVGSNNSNNGLLQEYAVTTDRDLFIWGAQIEALAFPTSYIPTVASQVTRAADSASMTGANFSQWYNQAQGAVYAESQPISLTSQGHNTAGISDGTINNAFYIQQFTNTQVRYVNRSGASDQAILSAGVVPTSNTNYKSAFAYQVNDYAASFDGGTIITDVLGILPSNVNRLVIGNLFVGSSQGFNGTIKKLAYYPIRLSNTNLQALTG
jgi:hypothetical protein